MRTIFVFLRILAALLANITNFYMERGQSLEITAEGKKYIGRHSPKEVLVHMDSTEIKFVALYFSRIHDLVIELTVQKTPCAGQLF